MTTNAQHTPGEIRARGMVDHDSGAAVDTRDELRAALRIVLDALDDERAISDALLAVLKNCTRAISEELLAVGDEEHPTVARHRQARDAAVAAIAQAEGA